MKKLDAELRAGKIGTIVVWRLDRPGRTVVQLLTFLEELDVAGVEFVSVRDSFDTKSASGRLLRNVMAQARGVRWGGRKVGQRTTLTKDKLRAIKKLLKDGDIKKTEICPAAGDQ